MSAQAQIDLLGYGEPNRNAHVTKSSKIHDYVTPQPFFALLDREFDFTLDVCATRETAKCKKFFTPQENGLAQRWGTNRCFMNPPYGHTERWMVKACSEAEAGALVVCLIPVKTHTWWFYRFDRSMTRLLRGRLRFDGMKSEAPFSQMIMIFRPFLEGPYGIVRWEWRKQAKQAALSLHPSTISEGPTMLETK